MRTITAIRAEAALPAAPDQRRAIPARRIAAVVLASVLSANSVTAQELVERTLAIVSGAAITLSDVRTAISLGLIEGAADVPAAAQKLVDRALVLREVERYAPQEPEAARIDERLTELRRRFSAAQFAAILGAGGFSESRLRGWIRDDLRIAAYLNQRFAADGPEGRENLVSDWIADLRRRTPVIELWKR